MKAGSAELSTPTLGRPWLQVLPEDQRETLFLRDLDGLERIGVQLDNPQGLELLSDAGSRVGPDRRSRIPAHLVEDALAAVPPRITVYDRRGQSAVNLENRQVSFCSQVDPTCFFDPFEYKPNRPLDHSRRVRQILHERKPEPLLQEVAVELEKMEVRWWSEVA